MLELISCAESLHIRPPLPSLAALFTLSNVLPVPCFLSSLRSESASSCSASLHLQVGLTPAL